MNIYTLTVEDASLGDIRVGVNTSDTEPLEASATTTELSEAVPTWDIETTYSGPYAARRALALNELAGSVTMQPLSVPPVEAGAGGYFVATDARRGLSRKQTDRQRGEETVSVDLARKGTRQTHLLGVETAPSQPEPGHEFGNDLDAIVGIPADARRVRIVDSTSSPTQRERPEPVETVEAEYGAVDLFDATSETIDEPTYLYDLDYQLQGDVDPGVWDTHGEADRVDEDGVVAWGQVFDTGHDFTGSVVFENGVLRVTIDEPEASDETASLEAEEYDADTDSWTTVALPEYPDTLDTDWQPADVDLTHIGQARLAAQVEFEAVAGVDEGDVYSVDVELERGRSDVEVWIPESVTEAIPADLEALLEPIASTSVVDSGAEQRLVARNEVRL